MKIGALSFRVIYQRCFLPFSTIHSSQPPPGNHPALMKHVAEITPGQSLLDPGIDPWPPLLLRIFGRAIAPHDVVGIQLSFQGMQYQRRRARA